MISAGEVGAIFTIKDEASVVLKRLIDQFNLLEAKLDKVKESLATLKMPGGLNRSIGNMERGLKGVAEQAERTAMLTKNGFRAIDESVAITAERVAALKAEMAGLGRAGGGLGRGGIGGGGGSGPHPGQGRGGMFHARSSGVSLPGGTHVTPNPGGDGFWGVVAVGAAALGIKAIVEAGGEFETQKKLLSDRLGINAKPGDMDSATQAAIRFSTGGKDGVIGTTPAENMKGITELLSVTPDLKSSIALYPQMMRAAKDLEELTHGKEKAEDNMKTLAKALENLGGGIDPKTHELDPARMQQATNEAVKTIIAGGGFIDAATLFGMAKQAGGMGRIADPSNLFDETITSLIDMGGQRTGTALAATGRQFLGDKMTKQTAAELEALGALPHGSWRSGGGAGIIMNPGYKIAGEDDIKSGNLPKFFLETLGPLIRAKVGDNNANLMQESYKIFGQQTGQRLGLMFLQNEAQRERDVNLRHGVDPAKVYQGIEDKDLGMNVKNLGSSFQSFMQVLGGPSVETAINGLHLMTSAMQGLTKAAAISPAADKVAMGLAFGPAMLSNAFGAVKDIYNHMPSLFGPSGPSGPGRDPRSPNTPLGAYPAGSFKTGGTDVHVEAPKVDTKVDVKVTLDGAAIAAAVMTHVTSAISAAIARVSGSVSAPAMHDGQMGPPMPDHGGGGSFSQP